MPDLQSLICEMYLQTSQGASTLQHVEATVSLGRVLRAPCKKRSPAEQARMMQRIEVQIKDQYLNDGPPKEVIVEALQRWEGVKVK